MKKYILPLMSIALLMSMASCSSSDDEVAENNNVESKLVPMTFTATQESNVGTRAALDNSYNVNWQENDAISVFDGTDAENNHKFILTGSVADGKFSGTASSTATSYTAVYPYTSGAKLESDGSVSGITIPAEQKAIDNSFDPAAALMMAVSTGENKNKLDFKNAVSLVKVTTQFACKKIVLSADKEIAGTGKLNYNNDAPSITFTSNTSKTVTLIPADGKTLIAAGTYYMAICSNTLNGFSISFTNSNDSKVYTRTSTTENTFTRSMIKNFGTFKEGDVTWTSVIESDGNVKASQQVDMGLTITGTDSKTYKVIFAKSNLKKTGLAEKASDFGDYFAWAATEPWCTAYTRNTSSATTTEWKNSKSYQTYDWSTVPYRDGENKYCSQYKNNGDVLVMSDDAARQILQGSWQLPTKEVWSNLYNTTNYKWEWTTEDGYSGRKVTSKTDNSKSIFLPAAGYVNGTVFHGFGNNGYYWSGTARSDTQAYILRFESDNVKKQHEFNRYYGVSVRPVRLVEEN